MLTVSSSLAQAANVLSQSDTAQLDAEILLTFVLKVSRASLYAWPQKLLTELQSQTFQELISRRARGEPIAYLVGKKEFWSLDFTVTPDVLIPRPETELLVEKVLAKKEVSLIADLGTGSGAIAIAIAHEKPTWKIFATDQSEKALNIAKMNANNNNIQNIHFCLGNWCLALPKVLFDVIVSNPPYIAENDTHLQLGSLKYEPTQALISGKDGLNAIRNIIQNASSYLKPGGLLVLEHGFDQAKKVRELLSEAGYHSIFSETDLAGIERITGGVYR